MTVHSLLQDMGGCEDEEIPLPQQAPLGDQGPTFKTMNASQLVVPSSVSLMEGIS
jgi:hypothetical protein